MSASITDKILSALEEYQVIYGTDHLAIDILGTQNKSWVICKVNKLAALGELTVSPTKGGRGRKTIIRRKNRNSPGSPCRTDKQRRRQIP